MIVINVIIDNGFKTSGPRFLILCILNGETFFKQIKVYMYDLEF